jgi:hypothetical protein
MDAVRLLDVERFGQTIGQRLLQLRPSITLDAPHAT